MRVTEYAFESVWRVAARPDQCWQELERMLRDGAAPTWWRAVSVTRHPSSLTVGERLDLAVRSPLGYWLRVRLTLSEVAPGCALGATSEGDLRGGGRLTIEPDRGGSVLRWVWEVRTERAWMNVVAPLARPAFRRAHESVMAEGERGLRRALAAG